MARAKHVPNPVVDEAQGLPLEVTPEVTADLGVAPAAEPAPEVVEAPVVTINLDPPEQLELPLSAQTLAEMEAGRASIARFQGE